MLILLETAERRRGIPVQTAFLQKELRKRRAGEHHLHRSGTVVVFAVVADRKHTFLHLDANHVLTALAQQHDIRDNAHRVAYLVRNALHQRICVLHADRFLRTVFDAEVDGAALRIGIATYPDKILVVPALLVLDCLVLFAFHSTTSA